MLSGRLHAYSMSSSSPPLFLCRSDIQRSLMEENISNHWHSLPLACSLSPFSDIGTRSCNEKKCWRRVSTAHAQVSPEIKKSRKNSQKVWYHSIVYHHKANDSGRKLKIYLAGLLRYGNPDCQNLGTLKIKIHIYGYLSFLSTKMGSDFIFRVAI